MLKYKAGNDELERGIKFASLSGNITSCKDIGDSMLKSRTAKIIGGAVLTASIGLWAGSASALVATVSGVAGDGESTVTLSGSETVTSGNSAFLPTSLNSDGGAWFDFGDFVSPSINNTVFTATSTSGVLTVAGADFTIDGIYLDDDDTGLDDFGVNVAGAVSVPFAPGDLISWTGVVTIPVDFSVFTIGAFNSNDFSFGDAVLDMTLQISAAQEVPVPSTLSLLAVGLVGLLGFAGRRSRKA